MDYDTDRARGILSPADRAYLLGEAEMTHEQSRRNAEARIRQRVTDGLRDFTLLVHALQTKDRRQVFEKSVDDPAFVDAVTAMVSFAYLGLKESGVEFDHVLEPAVRKAEEAYAAETLGSSADVSVTFDVAAEYGPDVADVAAKLRRGDPVTPPELFSVAMEDDAALSDVEEVVVQRGGEESGHLLERLSEYLDADVEELPMNRVRLALSGE